MPKYFRYAAAGLLIMTVLGVVASFIYFGRQPEFRMKGFPTTLSEDVVAAVSGYERREMTDNVLQYYIKADKATTFSDNHQELENVYLEVYHGEGDKRTADKITAQKAVYIPEEEKNFKAFFAGDVSITTADELNVKTEQVTYTRNNETATAEEYVEFTRFNVKGSSYGATVNSAERTVELLRDVEIETSGDTNETGSDISNAKINAAYAKYDNANELIDLTGDFTANIVSKTRTTDVSAKRAKVFLIAAENTNSRDVSKLEMFENVKIDVQETGGKPTHITSNYALYDKPNDIFDLRDNVKIITVEDEQPTTITAANVKYQRAKGIVNLNGDSQIIQSRDLLKGDNIDAQLNNASKLRSATITGNGFLKQTADDKTTEVSSPQMTAVFDDGQFLSSAVAKGSSSVTMTPSKAVEYTKITMFAPNAIRLTFKAKGIVSALDTEGRTTINFTAPSGKANASNKKVTADTIHTLFNADGSSLQKVEAIGNAELVATPLSASNTNYVTTVNASRFDCDFYESGNNVKKCIGSTKTKTVRVPTVSSVDRGTQTLTANTLTAVFDPNSGDVSEFNASDNCKFIENDRNAIADNITFTAVDEIVRLRGGEPTAWDSKARVKAVEIDWDTKNNRSAMRQKVSTTYYSQKTTGGSTPFSESGKPVFITADQAEFDHKTGVAVYRGSARGWQENNYVRGNEFVIDQKNGTFRSSGNTQSLLYDAKKTINGRQTKVPVYASADQLNYDRNRNLIHYQDNVDIRQGTDRITTNAADVFINEKNEVAQTIAEGDIVVTQPKRRAAGNYAKYDAESESVVIRGNPATVDDAESGSSQGGQITVYLKDNRVIGENPEQKNASGRTRSVYKVN